MAQHRIKVIQHNVLKWYNRRISLSNTYRIIDPDILINSHCMSDDTLIKIPGYTIHQKNTLNHLADGTAIAVKRSLQYKLHDNFISDLIAVEIPTTTGNIISKLYQPPARDFIPTPDFIRLFRRQLPVYMIADLNANHPTFNYQHTNRKGRQLNNDSSQNTTTHRS